MRKILIALSALLLTSCGATRQTLNTDTRDSTRVEVKTECVESIDTVYIEVPRQVEKTVTRDTVSHLENDYAVSDASIDTLGFLHHSLETKRQSLPVPVKSTSERRDSIIFRDKEVFVDRPVYVEKSLTVWQLFRLKSWWALLGLIVLAYRKEIFAVVRRFI